MSARWLLDIAALAQTSRAILRNHVALRGQQIAVYARTSSLRKGAERRVTSITSEPGVSLSLKNVGRENVGGQSGLRRTSLAQDEPAKASSTMKDRNHDDEPSQQHSALDPKPERQQYVVQTETQYEPSRGGSPVAPQGEQKNAPQGLPTYRRTMFSSEARREQGKSEAPIPSKVAYEPSEVERKGRAGIGGEHVFHDPPASTGPALSSLPRAKLPKTKADLQGSDKRVPDNGLNQDVYYATREDKRDATNTGSSTLDAIVSSHAPVKHESLEQLFHNPRIGQSLLGNSKLQNPYQKRSVPQVTQWPPKDHCTDKDQAKYDTDHGKRMDAKTQDIAKGISNAVIDGNDSEKVATKSEIFKMRESRVPSSRFGRLWQYAGLGASMTLGAAAEGFRRVTGSPSDGQSSLVLSPANIERLVTKLSRMRGAALKIGQLLSFQDSKALPPAVYQILQRVQDSADFMPASQRNKVLEQNLGSQWRDLFSTFDECPIAAASIGQVHGATLRSGGESVVVKIQYPGVANSIDSDLNNLSLLLHASRLLPKGLYLDKTIGNARTELAWECDYVREADAAKTFRRLLMDEQDVFSVPRVYDEVSGPQVLTMQRMCGQAVTKLRDLSQDQRDWIGTNLLRLCLREITEFKYMQTDPNWTNFLFDRTSQKIELLDFGASRAYPESFIEPYIRLLLAASRNDSDACRELSIQLGYLTGVESKTMLDTHIKSLTILAEPFKGDAPDVYDFREQTITDRVRALIPVMLKERLAPPPEETYSLHRKLSGAFLLLARLGSRVDTKNMFANAMKKAGAL